MTLGDVIRNYRETHDNMSMGDFAKLSTLSKPYISMLESNKNSNGGKPIIPSVPTLKKVAKAINVSLNDLMRMLGDEQNISLAQDENTDDISLLNISNLVPLTGTPVPIIGTIAAGKPLLAEENIEGYTVPVDELKVDFALRVKGDSMMNVPILDGDIVFIKKQPMVENGEIAAILVDREATLKRFYNNGNSVMLVSENPKYKPMIYTETNCDDFRVLGKAVAYQHSFEVRRLYG